MTAPAGVSTMYCVETPMYAVSETAYIGVSTQYIVDTPAGAVTVYVQNDRPGAHGVAPGDRLTLSWSPDCTFVVDAQEVA